MSRSTALLLVLFLGLGARPARADEPVPDVGSKDLPVVGTCAPIDSADVTRLLVGPTGLARMDGGADVLDHPTLVAALKPRAHAVAGVPSRHSVWITASAAQPFTPIRAVMAACAEAGIFRVGVEVKSEQGTLGFGFPMFLAGPRKAPPAGQSRLRGRSFPLILDRWEGAESNPRRIYMLAKRASDQFPPVVAEVSLDVNLSVQHVLTCLDLLYRGGCAGVRVGFRNPMVGRSSRVGTGLPGGEERGEKKVPTHLVAKVGKGEDARVLEAREPNVDVPPLAPRTQPWGDDGANAPGALDLDLEPLPVGSGGKPKDDDEEPLPTYAGVKEGAPTTAVVAANAAITRWTATLGKVLTDALALKWDPDLTPTRFVTRLRGAERVGALLTPVSAKFPGAQRVTPSTLRLDVYLLKGVTVVGKVETTIHTAGSAMSFVFAKWGKIDVESGDLTIPPAVSDPFAAGVPGHLRVWLEAAFSAVYRQGAGGLPLAPVNEVLAQLPAIAHASSTKALDARAPDMELLAKWLQVTEYDRLLIVPRSGTAGVLAEGRIAGILEYGLESEEKELRLSGITGRVAPK
jgi:hypothetical protein